MRKLLKIAVVLTALVFVCSFIMLALTALPSPGADESTEHTTTDRIVEVSSPTYSLDATSIDATIDATMIPDATVNSTPSLEPTVGVQVTTQGDTPIAPAVSPLRSSVNVRASPGTEYEIVGYLLVGTEATVLGQSSDGSWYRIRLLDGTEGWVGSSVVQQIELTGATSDTAFDEIEPGHQGGNISANLEPTETSEGATAEDPYAQIPESSPSITPAAREGSIEVFNVTPHTTTDGGLIIYGEVRNEGDSPVKNLEVTITLYDQAGNLLDLETAFASAPWQHNLWNTGVLYPLERAPFEMFFEDPGDWKETKTAISYDEATSRDSASHYRDLAIRNKVGRSIDAVLFDYQITGEVENIGSSACGNVWIVATLYDDEGNVVGVEDFLTDYESLSPGESAPFKIEMFARGVVEDYRLIFHATVR